ncbi:Asp23/Gls24 family envelope stress response protein [Heliobacterium gestii]|uniref:Asp23/Gls24 family envelope stress response protein n=1 Tax=Heliomicrobium gestii TaxID=2699 RepID=A0A845LF78_HELGE|nr:Asp23/Gls24 family envelope stress response protein [Heliomicrobium gestii]MBM7867025.1 putative alkaline shock family protein YloU [Heliomicrobium gestii]MZP43560.1 Asp23/Gls24 family envelope stress response protein [Heliomicrobium gestii]
MTVKNPSEMGSVSIADEVIANIAGQAAAECYGLVGTAPKHLFAGIGVNKRAEHAARGIQVNSYGDFSVSLDLHVIMAYGVRIPEVARTVMERVKLAIETQLGLSVREVNVHVHGLKIPD